MRPRILFAGPMLGAHTGWVPNPAEELAFRLREMGFSCDLVSNRINRFQRLFEILFVIFRDHADIDVISLQVYSGLGFFVVDAASFVARLFRIPIVMVLHGGELPSFFGRFPSWGRWVLRRAQKIVAPSGFLADTVRGFGLDAIIIPNAIDLEKYPFARRDQAQPNLLWMRTFHEVYNPLMAVKTLEKIKEAYPSATLTMGGQDKGMLNQVHQKVRELRLEDSVRFVGFLALDDKRREFAKHDIFLNTNRVDNMPISLVEAAAFGLPIVATAVGGVPYLLQHEETGILVQTEDAGGMAKAVVKLVENPELVKRLSNNGRILADKCGWPEVLAAWVRLFQQISC